MHFEVSSLSSWFILGSAGLFTVNQLGSNSPTSLTKPLIYCQLSSTFSLAFDFFCWNLSMTPPFLAVFHIFLCHIPLVRWLWKNYGSCISRFWSYLGNQCRFVLSASSCIDFFFAFHEVQSLRSLNRSLIDMKEKNFYAEEAHWCRYCKALTSLGMFNQACCLKTRMNDRFWKGSLFHPLGGEVCICLIGLHI